MNAIDLTIEITQIRPHFTGFYPCGLTMPLISKLQKNANKTIQDCFLFAKQKVRQVVRHSIQIKDTFQSVQEMPKYPFKPANLVHHDYDLKKRWYVECHVWSLADNGMVRRRYYGGINRYHTVVMRMKAGIGLEKEVNQMLKDGYIVKVEDPRPKTDDIAAMTIGEAFDFVIVRKENTVRPLSLTVYKSNVNQFKLWLVKKNMAKLRINQLTKSIVLDYMDSLFDAGRVSSNASYNNVFTVFRMIVNYLIDRDHKLFPIHPVKGVKQLKATAKKHAAFSKDEMSAIKLRMIEEGELQLLTFVQFMCYALIRPNELRNLKVGNIEIEKRRILIPRAVAKNGKSEYVDIYNPLLEVIN